MQNGKRLIDFIKANNWHVLPLQLVILRNCDSDTWQPVKPTLDHWDDTAVLLRDSGEVIFSVRATADPGRYYSLNPMNPRGCGRIIAGQHLESWERGYHFKQRAFVQCKPLRVQRDKDRDLQWSEEFVKAEIGMGLNCHTTGNSAAAAPPERIGKWSASCVVIRSASVFYNKLNPEFDRSGLKYLTIDVIDATIFQDWRNKYG